MVARAGRSLPSTHSSQAALISSFRLMSVMNSCAIKSLLGSRFRQKLVKLGESWVRGQHRRRVLHVRVAFLDFPMAGVLALL
jgi:hypothetical protein